MSMKTTVTTLFPTRLSSAIFIAYISLFVSQSLLVTGSKNSNDQYEYNTILVVFLAEALKLIICIIWYLKSRPSTTRYHDLYAESSEAWILALLYLVPSFLYCLYNNLTFFSLKAFDPTSYNCIMQFRIVLTAIIYQSLFNRRLTCVQWSSLCILTIGCLLKQYGSVAYDSPTHKISILATNNSTLLDPQLNHTNSDIVTNHMPPSLSEIFNVNLLILLFQMFCSCLAGVYNEYLIKSTGKDTNIIIQNIFMYIDSIICNLFILIIWPKFSYNFSTDTNPINPSNQHLNITDSTSVIDTLKQLFTPLVLMIIVNNAFSGIITSFFLKNLNSILKTYASALELFAIALLSWMIFGTRIDSYTVVALLFVSLAIIIYARNPVSIAPPAGNTKSRRHKNGNGGKLIRSRHSFTSLIKSDDNSENSDSDDDDDDEIDLYSYKFKAAPELSITIPVDKKPDKIDVQVDDEAKTMSDLKDLAAQLTPSIKINEKKTDT